MNFKARFNRFLTNLEVGIDFFKKSQKSDR